MSTKSNFFNEYETLTYSTNNKLFSYCKIFTVVFISLIFTTLFILNGIGLKASLDYNESNSTCLNDHSQIMKWLTISTSVNIGVLFIFFIILLVILIKLSKEGPENFTFMKICCVSCPMICFMIMYSIFSLVMVILGIIELNKIFSICSPNDNYYIIISLIILIFQCFAIAT
jgi:hypothetical protein